MIKSLKTGLLSPMTHMDVWWYVKQVIVEETVFRYVVLATVGGWWGVISGTVVWAWLHAVGFRWPMVAVCHLLGIGLGWLFLYLPQPMGLLACFVAHLWIGIAGYKLGIIQRWIREEL